MTENHLGFLCNIASQLSADSDIHKLLKSYYLMRCREVTKGYGLPPKHFSALVRCPHCCSEWTRDSDVKVKPLKLSKSQRQRIRSQKKAESNKLKLGKKKYAMHKTEMVQTCTFCKQSTATQLVKPPTEYNKTTTIEEHHIPKVNNLTEPKNKNAHKINKGLTNSKPAKTDSVVNLYTNAYDVFSLKNDKNTLPSTIKEPTKVIKNNKKRKDKFAGLCQKAVLASAKLKQQKEKETKHQPSQNKLNLFLRPSKS